MDTTTLKKNAKILKLEEENIKLLGKVNEMKRLEEENIKLLDKIKKYENIISDTNNVRTYNIINHKPEKISRYEKTGNRTAYDLYNLYVL